MGKRICLIIVFSLFTLTAAHAEDLSYLKDRVPRIDAHSAYVKYKSGKIIIADAMNPRTFAKYHILGAINLPTDSAANRKRWGRAKLPFPKTKRLLCTVIELARVRVLV
jgi:hypothetical protein